MKLEEAIAKAKILNDSLKELADEYEGQGSFIAAGMAVSFKLVLDTILSALRPVSREQVEQLRGEWINTNKEVEQICKCSKCGYPISFFWSRTQFCPNCGAPMTDEAVDIRLKELEALNDAD